MITRGIINIGVDLIVEQSSENEPLTFQELENIAKELIKFDLPSGVSIKNKNININIAELIK